MGNMGQAISVECIFWSDGRVRIRRVKLGASWHMVEQGRQWVDSRGRHVLIMLPGEQALEIMLDGEKLAWQLVPDNQERFIV